MADIFTWSPTVENLSGDATLKVRSAQFGDAYQQRVADGINNRLSSYNVQFRGNAATITAIIEFLDSHFGSTSFLWTPLLRAQALFYCEKYSEPVKDGNVYTITATFQQTFSN